MRNRQWFDREPLKEPDPEHCPKCWCGAVMRPVGRGKYPYPCRGQALWPDAMIFEAQECGHGGWCHEYSPWMEQPEAVESQIV